MPPRDGSGASTAACSNRSAPPNARCYANGATDATGAITSQTDRGYIAEEDLPDVSLVHLNARLYDPLIGRFVSADPIGLRGGANVYAYAGNNPVRYSDPTGLDGRDPFVRRGPLNAAV